MASSHIDVFNQYFSRQFWGNAAGSSGPNSAYELTPLLRQNLQQLLQDLNISHLVDAGCGDAALMRHLDLTGIIYVGIECVPALTELNQRVFAQHPNMSFLTQDIISEPLPNTDLILCRDVVHYLPNELIWSLLYNFLRSDFQYLLITHNIRAPQSANTPTDIGVFRPVNLTQAPFHLPLPLFTIDEDAEAKQLALWQKPQLQHLPLIPR